MNIKDTQQALTKLGLKPVPIDNKHRDNQALLSKAKCLELAIYSDALVQIKR